MPESFYQAVIFILGLAFGSFANVCIWRLPRGQEVVKKPSHCPRCQKPIRWFDNIPLLSFIILRGRCRACRRPIALRYPAVELASGLIFLFLFNKYGLAPALPAALAFGWSLLVISVIDVEHFLIPDVITYPGLAIALIIATLATLGWPVSLEPMPLAGPAGAPIVDGLLGMFLGGGFLLLAAWLGRLALKQEAMGGGDVKLAAMIGAFLGWRGLLVSLFGAFLLGSLVGVLLMAIGRVRGRRSMVPFGPFLSLGALGAIFWGRDIWQWYLGLLRP